jgi:N-methylhydantoinase A/oxoprolinase/acetone carboxylase beta subunit
VRVWHGGRTIAAQAWRRDALVPGQELRGPAIVSDDGATLWLVPGWRARAHASGAVVVTRGARR